MLCPVAGEVDGKPAPHKRKRGSSLQIITTSFRTIPYLMPPAVVASARIHVEQNHLIRAPGREQPMQHRFLFLLFFSRQLKNS